MHKVDAVSTIVVLANKMGQLTICPNSDGQLLGVHSPWSGGALARAWLGVNPIRILTIGRCKSGRVKGRVHQRNTSGSNCPSSHSQHRSYTSRRRPGQTNHGQADEQGTSCNERACSSPHCAETHARHGTQLYVLGAAVTHGILPRLFKTALNRIRSERILIRSHKQFVLPSGLMSGVLA